MKVKEKHICAYCNKEYEASKPFSHIIPKQFFRRFKRVMNNKAAYSTYYQRITQSEPVEFLLCYDCEQVFCKWENEFAKKITNKLYSECLPESLNLNLNVKLAALSVLWRILHCWVVSNRSKQGSLSNKDITRLSEFEQKWLEILREQRDFSREEGNIFIIPLDCVFSSNSAIDDCKRYPGILANVVYYDQGEDMGYYCIRCFVHKLIVFAYLTPAFSVPREFSIHNESIDLIISLMPVPIEDIFADYLEDSKKIRI